MATAAAYGKGAESSSSEPSSSFSSDPEDPGQMLNIIEERRAQKGALFPVSPLKPLHDGTGKMWDSIYQATHIKLGLTLNHLFQWASDVLPGTDDWGTTTDADLVASWS